MSGSVESGEALSEMMSSTCGRSTNWVARPDRRSSRLAARLYVGTTTVSRGACAALDGMPDSPVFEKGESTGAKADDCSE